MDMSFRKEGEIDRTSRDDDDMEMECDDDPRLGNGELPSPDSSRGVLDNSLHRQFSDPVTEDREIDYYELFCAQAGRRRRLSSSRDYGGSLPCMAPNDQKLPMLITSGPQSPNNEEYSFGGHLTVPCGNTYMRRTHSDCGADAFSQFTVPIPEKRKTSKAKSIWYSIKSIVDSCDLSPKCLSPPISPPFERFGHLESENTLCSSTPHISSSSMMRKRNQGIGHVTTTVTLDLSEDMRPRAKSFPGKNHLKRPDKLKLEPGFQSGLGQDDWQRIRHFVITPKGIINCGDSFRSKSCSSSLKSLASNGSGTGSLGSACSVTSHDPQQTNYRVLILGAAGVGKTTLSQQFLTSECLVEKESLYGTYPDI